MNVRPTQGILRKVSDDQADINDEARRGSRKAKPTRQPSKTSRLAFFRSQRHFVAVMLGALRNLEDPSNGAVPDLMDAVSDRVTSALRLQRLVDLSHICSRKQIIYLSYPTSQSRQS